MFVTGNGNFEEVMMSELKRRKRRESVWSRGGHCDCDRRVQFTRSIEGRSSERGTLQTATREGPFSLTFGSNSDTPRISHSGKAGKKNRQD